MTDTLFEMNDKGDVLFLHADMREALKALPENSVDSVVTDPPYHLQSIVKRFGKARESDDTQTSERVRGRVDGYARLVGTGFMNAVWDGGDIAYQEATWEEVIRVMKPGGYCAAFASTRGGHNMVSAMERAGFIIHPFIAWIFATGFPKATRVQDPEWEGWRYGTQSLKPAIEPIYVGQKPFSEKTGTANILRWRTGAINVDACRVEPTGERLGGGGEKAETLGQFSNDGWRRPWMDDPEHSQRFAAKTRANVEKAQQLGRWPANLIHDGSDEVVAMFPSSKGQQAAVTGHEPSAKTDNVYGQFAERATAEPRNDFGSAARFFYAAKASRADRAGSHHPTIKPISLMRYLTRLITPPGGLVLDPFAGSGTTGAAALEEGMRCLLIEREAEYADDIRRRLSISDIGLI